MPVTLKDIARKCDLAVSTVSNILNDNKDSFASERVKLKVKETAEALGYRKNYLSLSLRTRKTRSIGLCLDRVVDETRKFFIQSFVDLFNQQGFEVAINSHQGDPERAIACLEFFQDRHKDGIVFFTDFLKDIGEKRQTILDRIEHSGIKTLGIGSELKGVLPCLDIDRSFAFNQACELLLRQGHAKNLIVYKNKSDFREDFKYMNDERFVHMEGIYSLADFQKCWEASEVPFKGGVFFRTDEIAIPALKYLRGKGVKVPEDVSVISFDHFPFSEFTSPALTTYDICFDKLGEMAHFTLSRWITENESYKPEPYKLLKPTFVQRESHLFQQGAQ